MRFAHLHCHTCFSPDGLVTPANLIKVTSQLGMEAIAVTDHNTASSYIELYNAAQQYNVKPIFGNEFYYDYYQDGDRLFHITVLALNKKGYENIIALNNASHKNIVAKRNGKFPRMTAEMLYQYREGLIVLTGCPNSVMHETEMPIAINYVEQLIGIHSRENVFVELMFTMDNQRILERCTSIAERFQLPIVLTNDIHFGYQNEADIHPLTVKAKKGFSYPSEDLYIKTPDEMFDLIAKETDEQFAIDVFNTTNDLADSIEAFDIREKPQLPEVPPTANQELFDVFFNGKENDKLINADIVDLIEERFNLEWKVVNDMKLVDYFYIINDIKQFCKEKGIFLRLRGSGAGCYLLYLMEISPVHPIRYPLRFDRFLNYERQDYPDVDLDIEPKRRSEVFEYVKQRWGMIPVCTFAEYSHKSVIHDIVRVIASELDIHVPGDLEHNACEFGEDSEAFQTLLDFHPIIGRMYHSMIDTVRHRGKHAAAVATPISVCPIEGWGDELSLAWSESGAGRKELSFAGLVKIDLLGVDCLNAIQRLHELTNDKFTLDKADDEVFATFGKGIVPGVFQMKSAAAIKLGTQVQPNIFDDISAIIALNRPGPLDAGTAWLYGDWKKEPRQIDPRIDKYLERTYGVIVYQEQVMDIYSTITGEGSAGANDARKILCPKSLKILEDPKWQASNEKLKNNFLTKGLERGFSQDLLDQIWHEISTHARYSFNAAHSYSYAYNALEMAYYLVKYPVQYFFSLISDESLTKDGKLKIQEYLYLAMKQGVKIVRPHINVSTSDFVLNDNAIYLPLTTITGIGDKVVEKFLEIRKESGPFETLADFVLNVPKNVLNKGHKLKLYLCGAFDGLLTDDKAKDVKLLGIDYDDTYAALPQYELDYIALKMFLPNAKQVERIEKYRDNPNTKIGFIVEIEESFTKATNRPNLIYTLFPYGRFRQFQGKNAVPFEVGQFVGVNIDQYSYLLPFDDATGKKTYRIFGRND